MSNMNKGLKIKSYPFIDELVDKLYDKSLNDLIENSVKTPIDKKVFLMFIMMYFIIHLQLDNAIDKKETIKSMLNDLIGNREKRKLFITFFDEKFDDFQFTDENIKKLDEKFKKLIEDK